MKTFTPALAAAAFAGMLSIVSATPAAAQASGWQAWVGCWTASAPGQTLVDFRVAPVVCVAPTSSPDAVEITTLGETKLLSRDTIDASGTEHAVATKNCTGVQSARWSADQRRVYLRSATTCDGLRSTTSAILSMTPQGEWIEARGIQAGEGENVRVARYRAVQTPASFDSLGGAKLTAIPAARIAAGAPVGPAAVTEAARNADAGVVEAWIMERGQPFRLDAATLVSLADAGVPARITDAMVAVSNPESFHVARAESGEDHVTGQRIVTAIYPTYDPYGYRSRYGYGYGYGYSPYDYYLYNGLYNGYGRYGYGYGYGGGFYSPPIIVINGSGDGPHGQVVKGRGYTQNGGTENTGRTATTRDRAPAAQPTASTAPASSSSSSSSSSSNSSTSSERTAHARP